jgi:hypothetical protein
MIYNDIKERQKRLRIMKKSFNDLLKGIFLTSMASLNGTNVTANNIVTTNKSLGFDRLSEGRTTDLEVKTQKKFLLKFNKDKEGYIIAGHSSHASHASHSSHYSSYYSGSSSTTSTNSDSYSSSPSTASTTATTKKAEISYTANSYKLGDRILKKGMKGYDVTELLNILIGKQYIIPKEGELSVATGLYEFSELIEIAVKKFQKANKLTNDGIVGPLTVYYLKK